MKKRIGLFLCALVILVGCSAEKNDAPKETVQASTRNRKVPKLESRARNLSTRARRLAREKKPAEALAVLNELIQLKGENRRRLGAKHELLMKLERYEEALAVALRRDEITERKSPWNSIPIVETYLKLGNLEKALEYLAMTVKERHFIYLDYLEGDAFDPLRNDPRFAKLKESMKEMIGIGKPATDFSIPLITGENYVLSEQKGGVILVDFWATWCPPCRKALPLLKELRARYKGKGFQIIGISLDRQEKTLRDFIDKEKIAWKIAFSGKDWNDETVKRYRVSSIPSTFLIDRQGILRHFNLHGRELEDAIRQLLEDGESD